MGVCVCGGGGEAYLLKGCVSRVVDHDAGLRLGLLILALCRMMAMVTV